MRSIITGAVLISFVLASPGDSLAQNAKVARGAPATLRKPAAAAPAAQPAPESVAPAGTVVAQPAESAPALSYEDLLRINESIKQIREALKTQIKDQLAAKGEGRGMDKPGEGAPSRNEGSPVQRAISDAGSGTAKPPVDSRPGGALGLTGGAVTPSRYTGTVGGNRINRGSTQDYNNIKGGTQGQVSEGDGGDDLYSTICSMLSAAGGVVTGDRQRDANEAAYMMSVGVDGWNATKNMSGSQRAAFWAREAASQRTGGATMTHAEAAAEVARQRSGGYDNPDADPAGGFRLFGTPVMQELQLRFVRRAIAARRARAGGGDDPRTDQAGATGGAIMPQAGADDGIVHTQSAGSINWDEVCKINELVNPPR